LSESGNWSCWRQGTWRQQLSWDSKQTLEVYDHRILSCYFQLALTGSVKSFLETPVALLRQTGTPIATTRLGSGAQQAAGTRDGSRQDVSRPSPTRPRPLRLHRASPSPLAPTPQPDWQLQRLATQGSVGALDDVPALPDHEAVQIGHAGIRGQSCTEPAAACDEPH
jgi:hypothetical protein